MPSRDLHNNIQASRGLSPAAIITGDGTSTTEIIDTAGFESVEFIFATGAITDGDWTITVFEGDESNMSDEAEVADADLIGTEPTFAATDDNKVKKVGYRGSKQFTRAKAVQANSTTGGFLTCIVVMGHARNNPVT